MTIEEIRKKKREVELDIAQYLGKKLSEMHDTTGVCPRDVSVRIVNVTEGFGSRNPIDFVIENVTIDLGKI